MFGTNLLNQMTCLCAALSHVLCFIAWLFTSHCLHAFCCLPASSCHVLISERSCSLSAFLSLNRIDLSEVTCSFFSICVPGLKNIHLRFEMFYWRISNTDGDCMIFLRLSFGEYFVSIHRYWSFCLFSQLFLVFLNLVYHYLPLDLLMLPVNPAPQPSHGHPSSSMAYDVLDYSPMKHYWKMLCVVYWKLFCSWLLNHFFSTGEP